MGRFIKGGHNTTRLSVKEEHYQMRRRRYATIGSVVIHIHLDDREPKHHTYHQYIAPTTENSNKGNSHVRPPLISLRRKLLLCRAIDPPCLAVESSELR